VLHSFTANELDCLAKNIYYEARGESELGQLAVATVTLNRALLAGGKICKVVYSQNMMGCQFSWVCEAPREPYKKSEPWLQAMMVAQKAASGDTLPELKDAIYFHAKQVHPAWAAKKQKLEQIGNHIFYGESKVENNHRG